MPGTLGRKDLVGMFCGAVEQIRINHEALSKLDSFGGDGDHGTTMLRAMEILAKTLSEATTPDTHTLIKDIGWAIMGVDGGATGPLFGTFFGGMSEPASGKEAIDGATLAAMFEGGLAAVRKRTKAQPGDKTMVDALVPAVQAARSAADSGADVHAVLTQAAHAAEKGALATKDMQAKFGRAKNIGAKSIGNPDPGATSVSLIFKGFVEGVKNLA